MVKLVDISRQLAKDVDSLRFSSPITHVYNPLSYARIPHEKYLKHYGKGPKEILLLGMNPGPWGMAQSGVPFGDIAMVRDWLEISGRVEKPKREHPKRPVDGFDCARSEVSGSRLWGWAKDRYKEPEDFFERFFVHNYCPLSFMEESARNFTPDKLPAARREKLFEICDRALLEVAKHLKVKAVVGVGAFAEQRANIALAQTGIHIDRMLHPSPASPKANRGWANYADADLQRVLRTL